MTREPEEPEPEVSAVASARSENDSGETGTLMEVTFQRSPRQKQKFLEAEPKILGVTEIMLAIFFIGCRSPFYLIPSERLTTHVMLAFSLVAIISGGVAIAAENLHVPTLKACLGMQVVTCVAYTNCLFTTFGQHYRLSFCHYSDAIPENSTCLYLEEGLEHLSLIDQLTEVTQIIVSITLAAYCCKVIPCCTPTSHVPVITITQPTAPQ